MRHPLDQLEDAMRLLLLTMILWVVPVGGMADNDTPAKHPAPIPFTDLSESEAQRQALANALKGGQPVMLHFQAGEAVPLAIQVDTPVFELAPARLPLVVKRDVYVRISKEGVTMSPDGQRWADTGDMAAIKALFGIGAGTFSGSVQATEKDGAYLSFFIGMQPASQ